MASATAGVIRKAVSVSAHAISSSRYSGAHSAILAGNDIQVLATMTQAPASRANVTVSQSTQAGIIGLIFVLRVYSVTIGCPASTASNAAASCAAPASDSGNSSRRGSTSRTAGGRRTSSVASSSLAPRANRSISITQTWLVQ
jgi:hypothetical protein